jgi:hypothetical protein
MLRELYIFFLAQHLLQHASKAFQSLDPQKCGVEFYQSFHHGLHHQLKSVSACGKR